MSREAGQFEMPARTSADASGAVRRYRLAFAIQRYFEFGGLQRDLRRVALACAARGHEVHILTSQWKGERPDGLHVHILPLSARSNHARCRQFANAVGEFVSREAFDCLTGFDKSPGLDVYWSGDACLAERLRQRKLPLLRWLPRYRTLLALEAAVLGSRSNAELLVLSEPEEERIVRHYAPRHSRLHLLPPGIDRRRFEPRTDSQARTSIRQELRIADRELIALLVGSSFKTKGVDRAIRALHSLPHAERSRARLLVVGDGQAAPFERLARRLGLADRVHFTGARDDVADFYRTADVLLHPARTEAAGHTLLEAMICGLPVLATANCGYAIHVQRGLAGLLCPDPFEQATLNRLLAEMLSDKAARLRWKQNALAYCRSTDLYSMVEQTVEVIVRRAEENRRAA